MNNKQRLITPLIHTVLRDMQLLNKNREDGKTIKTCKAFD